MLRGDGEVDDGEEEEGERWPTSCCDLESDGKVVVGRISFGGAVENARTELGVAAVLRAKSG